MVEDCVLCAEWRVCLDCCTVSLETEFERDSTVFNRNALTYGS